MHKKSLEAAAHLDSVDGEELDDDDAEASRECGVDAAAAAADDERTQRHASVVDSAQRAARVKASPHEAQPNAPLSWVDANAHFLGVPSQVAPAHTQAKAPSKQPSAPAQLPPSLLLPSPPPPPPPPPLPLPSTSLRAGAPVPLLSMSQTSHIAIYPPHNFHYSAS